MSFSNMICVVSAVAACLSDTAQFDAANELPAASGFEALLLRPQDCDALCQK